MSAPKKVKRIRKSDTLNVPMQVFIKTQILAAIIYTVTFIAAGIVSLSADLPEKYMFYVTVLSFSADSFACAAFAGNKLHKNGMITGLLFCLPFNTLVIFISAIVNSFKVDLTAAVAYFILIVISMLGGIISVNSRSKPKVRVK